jgi:hypothetical protein
VSALQGDADGNTVAIRKDVVDANVCIGKGTANVGDEGLEFVWPVYVLLRIAQPMRHGISGKQFVDRCLASLIPDFFKPSTYDCYIPFAHLRSSGGQGYHRRVTRTLMIARATDESFHATRREARRQRYSS